MLTWNDNCKTEKESNVFIHKVLHLNVFKYIPKIVNVKIFVSYYWHNDLFIDDLCVIIGCCTTFSIALSRLCGNQNLPRHPERPTRNPELGKDLPYGNPHGLRPYEGVMQAIEY